MWTIYHVSTFILTFVSYAFFHATRKTFSNVKSTISSEWSETPGNRTLLTKPDQVWNAHHMFHSAKDVETYLGILDAVFMVSYAVGLYISGIIGDRFELRKVLAIGMCTSALSVFLFGSVLEWAHYYNKYLYVIVWIFNGLLQSTGWPTVVAVMGNWFGKSSRGFVLGLWSACASVGNIMGALMVSQILKYGYDMAFLVTSTVLSAGGIVNFFGLVNSPNELGLSSPDELVDVDVQIRVNTQQHDSDMRYIEENPDTQIQDNRTENDTNIEETGNDTEPLLQGRDSDGCEVIPQNRRTQDEALSFWKALLLPGVLLYAFAYFCLKLVNYSFFFWLPYYLHAAFSWSEATADKISIWYDVGGIIGGTFAGLVSDCFQRRSIVVVPMLVLAIPSLVAYNNSPNDKNTNAFLMTVTGFFIGGVANLISAAVSADLGKQGPIQGNKAALATVTGIVDGTGSVGAAIGQILVPLIQEQLGWRSVFYLFIIMTALTIFCVLPMFFREVPQCFKDTRNFLNRYSYTWYRGVHSRSRTRDIQRRRSRSRSRHAAKRKPLVSTSSSANTVPNTEDDLIQHTLED